jgi:hypothetical protein
MVLQKPEHMRKSVYSIVVNMLETREWGITWLVFLFLLGLSFIGPRLPFDELFFYGIPAFFSVLTALVYFRNPYHTGWGDSANRMFTHILPIVVLYVLMKAAQGIWNDLNSDEKDTRN